MALNERLSETSASRSLDEVRESLQKRMHELSAQLDRADGDSGGPDDAGGETTRKLF